MRHPAHRKDDNKASRDRHFRDAGVLGVGGREIETKPAEIVGKSSLWNGIES